MDDCKEVFKNSSRKWELIIYPSLFAFVVLSAYGFFLIYRLANDMHGLTEAVTKNMYDMSYTMQEMSSTFHSVNSKMAAIEDMSEDMKAIRKSMQRMEKDLGDVNLSAYNMQRDMGGLNRNIGKPMSMFNSMMPW